MENLDPKFQIPIDVKSLKESIASENKPGIVPTIIIRSDSNEQEQSKVRMLEKLVKAEILLNIFLALAIAVSLYVFFVLRFDILKYISRKSLTTLPDEQAYVKQADFNYRVVVAEAKSAPDEAIPGVYITGQGVDLDKAFQASSSGKLTAYGKLNGEVMGFLPYWAVPKLKQIDTRAITSISYFGLEMDGHGEIVKNDTNNRPLEAWSYLQKDEGLDAFIKKARNSKLKVYLTLKCFNQDNIVTLTTSAKARERFIYNALYLMNSKSFDGINIDFEYIGTPETKVRDGFSALMIDLYKAMKAESANSVLTIDTFVDAAATTRIHDIPVLAQNSDGLVIMAYDFHTPASSAPGSVAPMEGAGLSIKGLMSSYLDKAPADKLILAVPYYGYDWPVEQRGNSFTVVGSRQQVNIVAYGEITDATKNTKILWDENAQTPWYTYQDPVTKQTRITYFENVRSLGIKYDYVRKNKMQGIAIWALGFDGQRTELNQTLIDKFAE